MKEIKFKVWDNQKGRWASNSDVRESMGLRFGVDDVFEGQKVRFEFHHFTGLKDKNGTEVFDGDLLRVRYRLGDKSQYHTDSIYKVYASFPYGVRLAYTRLYNESDQTNQYPIYQNMDYGDTVREDHRNDKYDQLAIMDKYYEGRLQNHYSNEIEIIGNTHTHPSFLTPQTP